jgi:hypothetical protein
VKRAAVSLRRFALAIATAIGLEGAFLLAGTVLLAVAASYVAPAGPFVVVGVMCILAGIALAIPPRRAA